LNELRSTESSGEQISAESPKVVIVGCGNTKFIAHELQAKLLGLDYEVIVVDEVDINLREKVHLALLENIKNAYDKPLIDLIINPCLDKPKEDDVMLRQMMRMVPNVEEMMYYDQILNRRDTPTPQKVNQRKIRKAKRRKGGHGR